MTSEPQVAGALLRSQMRLLFLALAVAAMAGTASAIVLVSLDRATALRLAHPWLLALLPLAGFVTGWLYLQYGRDVERGSHRLVDEIRDPRQTIPLRLAPMVLGGTVLSHLCGASVGREGTAVQMGGALADQLTPAARLSSEDRAIMLMAGISAGFASVFGTPFAGMVFGLEVAALGRVRWQAVLPCFVAALVGDQVSIAWGVLHTAYAVPVLAAWSFAGLAALAIAGAAFGLAGRAFVAANRAVADWVQRRIAYAPLRPLLGGAALALAAWGFGAQHYLGLGIPTIVQAFEQPLPPWDFAGKWAFTVLSLGSGFKGGEVTPLFFIGATLGNALAPLLHQPVALLAAVGFVAVFGGAAGTPIASTVMAVELFGPGLGVPAAIACAVAARCVGRGGIYPPHAPTEPAAQG